jgi:hypothetical protein
MAVPGPAPSLTPSSLTPLTLNPEPGAEQLTEPKKPAGYQNGAMEDDFKEFRDVATKAGMNGSEYDWHEARFSWKVLDYEQRHLAINGIRERSGTGDMTLASLPGNYLKKQMWQRPIRSPTPSVAASNRETPLEMAKKRLEEKARVKS